MSTAPEELRAGSGNSTLNGRIAVRLAELRERTLSLISPLSEDALNRVHDKLMSPIVWDLGHIASFEDLWLVQNAFGREPLRAELGDVYDPFTAPRSERGKLPYLHSEDCLAYADAVRRRTLDCLEAADLEGSGDQLLAGGYVYEMVLRHEMQHQETILQTLQLMTCEDYSPPSLVLNAYPAQAEASSREQGMVLVESGDFQMGTDRLVFSYDNERPLHDRRVDDFLIDETPVTNDAFAEFVEAGGYRDTALWSEQGRKWRSSQDATMPRFWRRAAQGFEVRSFGAWEPLPGNHPVCHVSWYEAEAYANFAGKRLPTEAEWERAAGWDAATQHKLRYPWGDALPGRELANVGQASFGTTAVGTHSKGVTPEGVSDLIGNVWEWTSSGFDPYPGFEPFPYREYSAEFFGGPYRVLRGGSWATQPEAVDSTFRNWDYPERSQIFAGFRCAMDAEKGSGL